MAKACLKVFIDNKMVRRFGGNRSDIAQYTGKLKEMTMEELSVSYPSIIGCKEFRFSISRKRKNRLYRFPELITSLSDDEIESISILKEMFPNIIKEKLNSSGKKLEFDEECNIKHHDNITSTEVINGFVTKEDIVKHGYFKVLVSIVSSYKRLFKGEEYES